MTTTERVTWLQSGHAVCVDVNADGFTATVDGKRQSGSRIAPPAPKDKSLYDARDAAGNIGSLIIYCPRAKELEAIRARLIGSTGFCAMSAFYRLEDALEQAGANVRNGAGNPTYTYHALEQAKEALHTWCEANRNLYEAEVARRKAAEQARMPSTRADMWS